MTFLIDVMQQIDLFTSETTGPTQSHVCPVFVGSLKRALLAFNINIPFGSLK